MNKVKGIYNFKLINKNKQYIYKYYDEESVRVLYIFKSGWKDRYHCVVEDPQYQENYLNTFTSGEIEKNYNINTFSRINKLKKIYDSNL